VLDKQGLRELSGHSAVHIMEGPGTSANGVRSGNWSGEIGVSRQAGQIEHVHAGISAVPVQNRCYLRASHPLLEGSLLVATNEPNGVSPAVCNEHEMSRAMALLGPELL
jgi:hypothetical protein